MKNKNQCSLCEKYKLITEFPLNAKNKSSRRKYCKECKSKLAQEGRFEKRELEILKIEMDRFNTYTEPQPAPTGKMQLIEVDGYRRWRMC